jgi:hypothetical protein
MYLKKFFENKTGKYMLSIILGIGIASLFRKVCKGTNCIVYKAPPLEEIKDNIFKYDNQCYKYNPVLTKCDPQKRIIESSIPTLYPQ